MWALIFNRPRNGPGPLDSNKVDRVELGYGLAFLIFNLVFVAQVYQGFLALAYLGYNHSNIKDLVSNSNI